MKLKSKILHFITSNFTCRRHQHLRRILKPNPMSVATIDIPQNTIIQFWFTGQNLNHFSNPHFEKFVFRQLNQNKHLHHIKSQNTSWVAECWESWLILIWGQLPFTGNSWAVGLALQTYRLQKIKWWKFLLGLTPRSPLIWSPWM